MSEITLVTAYFNIGREKWTGFNRGDEKYLSYFEHWARMRNKLIVYTSPAMCEKVMEIRTRFGLADRTTVIPVEDVTQCAPELYQTIKQVMMNKESWLFHKKLDHPESWNYDYNYVTGLKPYWVCDAISRGLAKDMIAWIDFGYDHGGEEFPHSEDFDFCWQYDFDHKIHLSFAKVLDDKPIFKIVKDMDTYARGNLIIAPAVLWRPYWESIVRAIRSLADCGLADDDQTLEVMAYRENPQLFKTTVTSYWAEMLHVYGPLQLRVQPRKREKPDSLDKKYKQFIKEKKKRWDIHHRHGIEIEKKYFD